MKLSPSLWIAIIGIPLGIAAIFIGLAGSHPGRSNTASIFFLPQASFGTTPNFAVLGATSISSLRTSTITGDVGNSPGTTIGGITVTGTTYVGTDPVATQAQTDLTYAYNEAKFGPGTVTPITTSLDDLPLEPGIYSADTFSLSDDATLTLDGTSDPTAAFIFRADKSISIGSGTHITLINTTACNVFWQSNNSATIGSDSIFNGTVMAQNNIILSPGAGPGTTVYGRLLARKGFVAMDNSTVIAPICIPQANLTVIKQVDTPYGGTAQPSDFAITVTGSNVSTPNFSGSATGTSVTLDANQNYSVSESSVAGYTQTSMSPECSGTLAPYESKTCTIINTQDAPPPIDTEEIIPNRRTSSSANPKITIKKTANPLALSAGAGFVSYAYLVENTGNVSLSNIKVVDNHCTYVNYVFGDSDEYDVLEVGETWSYICTDYLTQTTENIGTVTGEHNGDMVKNSDRLTVTVTAPQQKFLEEKKIIEEPKSTDSSDSTTPKFPTTGYPPR